MPLSQCHWFGGWHSFGGLMMVRFSDTLRGNLCPHKDGEGPGFLPADTMHRRHNSLALAWPAALILWGPYLSGFVVTCSCLPSHLPQIAIGREAGMGGGCYSILCWVRGFFRSWGRGPPRPLLTYLWPTEPLTMKMSSIVLLNLSHCC